MVQLNENSDQTFDFIVNLYRNNGWNVNQIDNCLILMKDYPHQSVYTISFYEETTDIQNSKGFDVVDLNQIQNILMGVQDV